MRYIYAALSATTLLAGSNALACTIMVPPPSEQFEGSRDVVLAIPKAISFRPSQASKPSYDKDFRQTILWQVLLSWKGKYRAGDKFTTRVSFSGGFGCTSVFPIYSREPQLLYLRDMQPYADFHASSLRYAPEDFKYLEARGTLKGNGT